VPLIPLSFGAVTEGGDDQPLRCLCDDATSPRAVSPYRPRHRLREQSRL